MAKRFTDSEKWKDDWYISLSNDDKIVWQWLLDNCTHSGLCKRSMGLLNMMCKVSYTEPQMVEIMDGRVIIHESYWFIPKFLKFQYSTLFSKKPAIISVVKDIFLFNLRGMIPESFGNDYLIKEKSFDNHCKMIKDMVKDMDTVKDSINGKSPEILKGEKFSEDGLSVIFPDGSEQGLTQDQKNRLKEGTFKPHYVKKEFSN